MRELAIGDIHGCADSFAALLEIIQPQPTDVLVLLGDYIDRGPDSCAVLDMILQLSSRCTVVPLVGNHERMLFWAKSDPESVPEWLKQGGRATLNSYHQHGFAWEVEAIPERHWKFLFEQTLNYWETDERIFVHGFVDPQLDMEEQPDFLLFWQQFTDSIIHKSGKQIICGHTSQKSGLPAVFQGGICIDTWVYGSGWLTCYDTQQQIFTQTNERGGQRSFPLSKLRSASAE